MFDIDIKKIDDIHDKKDPGADNEPDSNCPGTKGIVGIKSGNEKNGKQILWV
jgi:hypothetical protein